jgi:hypothetical protein
MIHGKFIQISTILTANGIALYALDEDGHIFEKLVATKNAKWFLVD